MKNTLLTLIASATLLQAAAPEEISRIYVVNRDGSNLRLVADETALPEHTFLGSPAWSPDGDWIVFDTTRNYKWSSTHVVKVAVNGPDKGKLVDLGVGLGGHYSPDGNRMAFFINGKNPMNVQAGLWVMNSDGTDRKRLAWGLNPQWSPDGRRLLCVGSHKSPRQVFAFDLEPFKRHALLTNEVALGLPAWAPDGKRFVMTVKEGEDRVMAIFTPEEKTTRRVELWREKWHKGYEETWPDWSPDGKRIVFTRYTRNTCNEVEILIIAAEAGAHPVKLDIAPPCTCIRDCQWSPDGSQIAFAAMGPQMLRVTEKSAN